MAHPIPKLLFRAWSGDSRGANCQALFKPASQCEQGPVHGDDMTPESIPDCGAQLERAVLWKKNGPPSPFIFFSESLLFVLQLAYRMRAQGQQNICITCIYTDWATTITGSSAKFYSVDALLTQFGKEITNRSDGSKRRYSHEYAAVTSISTSAGSSVLFDTLISVGLFDLYPELQGVNQRHNVKLHRAVTDLRAFGFDTEQALSKEKIDVAARLAFSFKACSGPEDANLLGFDAERALRRPKARVAANPASSTAESCGSEDTDGSIRAEMHMLAWFLSLRKRNVNDPALNSWLASYSQGGTEYSTKSSEDESATVHDPEVLQDQELATHLENRTLYGSRISSLSSIDPRVIAQEKAAWQAWRQISRDEYRAQRAVRTNHSNYQPRRRRYERSRSPRRDRTSRERDYRRSERSRSPRRDWRRRDQSGLRR